MANIVQVDDFTGLITIAQISQQEVRDAVTEFIEIYEPEFLTMALGVDLYNLLLDGLVFNEDGTINEDETPEIWLKLITQLGTSIANYIYYKYQQENNTQTSGIGETKGNLDNAVSATPMIKMCRRWNEMVEIVHSTVTFINNNQADYEAYYIANLFCYGYFNWYCNRPEIFDKINSLGL
jgi:hypothetical protein